MIQPAKALLSTLEKAEFVYGDGAYDNQPSYTAAQDIGAYGVFPPREGACLSNSSENTQESQRDVNIIACDLFGLNGWKTMMHYGLRSLSENAFSRLKTIFGDRLMARTGAGQAIEVATKIKLLNDFRALGMPISRPIR